MVISEVLFLVLPGLAGSVVAIFYDENLGLKRAVSLIFLGCCCSFFILPAVIEYLQFTEKIALATNFLVARYADLLMKSVTELLPSLIRVYFNKIVEVHKKKEL